MLPLDSRTASYGIVTSQSQTRIVTLYKPGTAPKVVALAPGYYLCRVPNGVFGKSVQILYCKPSDTPSDADMALPTVDTGPKAFDSRDSASPFIVGMDPELDPTNEKKAIAIQWDGAADSTLIITKIK